jgi:leucyl aminopeptidase
MTVRKIEAAALLQPPPADTLNLFLTRGQDSLPAALRVLADARRGDLKTGFAQLVSHNNTPMLLASGDTAAVILSAAGAWCASHRNLNFTTLHVYIHPEFQSLNPYFVVNELMNQLYVFDKYKTERVTAFRKVVAFHPTPERYAPHYLSIALAQRQVRMWVDEPANIATPLYLAQEFRAMLEPLGVKISLLGLAELKQYKMNLLLAAAQGSKYPPFVVVAEYKRGGDKPLIALTGKGVTYDTGGINLKPSGAMRGMKCDMAGAALVMGTLAAIAHMQLPVNVMAVVGMVENMIGENATRPGDVVVSMSGKSIEITDTDAEGRMVLGDVLWFTGTVLKPDYMLDVATLTGAISVSLGSYYGGLFSNNDELVDALLDASDKTEEYLWHMPMLPTLKKLKSSVADLQNYNDRERAGALYAATFLQEFVPPNVKGWAHLDLAGMLFDHGENLSKPYGVKLLMLFLMSFNKTAN